MTRMKLFGALVAGLALVACGDNDGGSGRELDDKRLDELTAEEAQIVCNDVRASSSVSKEDMCDIAGLLASALGEDCATIRDQCISSPDEPEPPDSCDSSQFAGCDATVAEAKACLSASMDQFRALTCTSSLEDLMELPAACQGVAEKCPELLSIGGDI